jgi:large subunit ribosomal protein L21
MIAYIKTGGKQYKVKKGDVLDFELLGVNDGEEVEFKEVLMIRDPDAGVSQVGLPYVEGAVVKGKVLGVVQGEKTIAFKFKRRQNYQRKVGHRQKYSRVEITNVVG